MFMMTFEKSLKKIKKYLEYNAGEVQKLIILLGKTLNH